jgi:membrane-associated phospholipid phosphatase
MLKSREALARATLPGVPSCMRAGLGALLFGALLVVAIAGSPASLRADERLWDMSISRHGPAIPPALLRVRLPIPAATPGLERSFHMGRGLQAADSVDGPWTLRKWLPLIVVAGLGIGLQVGLDEPSEPRWTARNSFDDSARGGLRIASDSGRKSAATASSVLLATSGALLLGDWALERDLYSPIDSFRIDSTWIFGSGLATIGVKHAAARNRPYVHACEAGLTRSGCDEDAAFESFYSGHTSWSATMSGLVCARRLHRPDRKLSDLLWCGGASSITLAAGFLRIAADEHWMTDVLAGWAVGLVFGYVLPSYFNYGSASSSVHRGRTPSHSLVPIAGSRVWGLRYQLVF